MQTKMIKFDLKRALAGDAVVNRMGNDMTGFKANDETQPGYGFSAEDSKGSSLSFTDSGKYWNRPTEDNRDLFIKYEATKQENTMIPFNLERALAGDKVINEIGEAIEQISSFNVRGG